MDRVVLSRVAVAVAVMLVTVTATAAAMTVVDGNGGASGLIASLNGNDLLGFLSGQTGETNGSRGAGFTVTVRPASHPDGSNGPEESDSLAPMRGLVEMDMETAATDLAPQVVLRTGLDDGQTGTWEASNPDSQSGAVISNTLTAQIVIDEEEEDPIDPPPPPPDRYMVTIAIDGQGTVAVDGDVVSLPFKEEYREGTQISLRAIPNAPGYVFGHWMIEGQRVAFDPSHLTVDHTVVADVTITGVFVRPPAPPPGQFEIWIPPFAGPETIEIGISTRMAEEDVCLPDGPVDGLVYEIQGYLIPDGAEAVEIGDFDHPAFVKLTYEDELDAEDAERIGIHYFHNLLGMWIPIPTQVDVEKQQVTGQIYRSADHLMCIKDKFTDIDGHWGERYILFLSEVGAVDGYPDKTFQPGDLVSREQFTKMLVEASGLDLPNVVRLLPALMEDSDDVSEWARRYVEAALIAGLVSGYDDGTFRPKASVTRVQAAVMLSRALGLAPVGAPDFLDAENIPAWGIGHVAALSDLEIIRGIPSQIDSGMVFGIDLPTTRVQAAAFLVRYVEERLRSYRLTE